MISITTPSIILPCVQRSTLHGKSLAACTSLDVTVRKSHRHTMKKYKVQILNGMKKAHTHAHMCGHQSKHERVTRSIEKVGAVHRSSMIAFAPQEMLVRCNLVNLCLALPFGCTPCHRNQHEGRRVGAIITVDSLPKVAK